MDEDEQADEMYLNGFLSMNGTEEDHVMFASPHCTMLDETPPVTPGAVSLQSDSRSSATSKINAILELLERKPSATTPPAIPTQKQVSRTSSEANIIDQAEARLESMKKTHHGVPVLDDDGKFLERLLKFEQKNDAERLASDNLSAKLLSNTWSSSSSSTIPIDNQPSPSIRMQLPYPAVQTRMISDLSMPSVHSIDIDPALDLTSLTDITSVGSVPPFRSHRNVLPRQPHPQPHRHHQQRQTPSSSSSRAFLHGSTNHDSRSRGITATTTRPSPITATPTPTSSNSSRNVHVVVRVRPFTLTEQNVASRRIVSYHDNQIVIVNPQAFDADPDAIANAAATVQCKEWAQVFRFDRVLWSHPSLRPSWGKHTDSTTGPATQQDVYHQTGVPIVEHILKGNSATCFAYGHTGSGKTYSLFGQMNMCSSKGITATATIQSPLIPSPPPLPPPPPSSSSSSSSSSSLPHTKSLQDFSLIENYTERAYALQRGATTAAMSSLPTPSPHIASSNLQAMAIENYTEKEKVTVSRRRLEEEAGLVPRVIQDIIEGIHHQQHHHQSQQQQQQHQYHYRDNSTSVLTAADVRVTLSFIEIHNDKIRDLLSSTTDGANGEGGGLLRIREHPVVGPYVEGVSRYVVNGNVDKALSLISTGLSRRMSSGGNGNGSSGGGGIGVFSKHALSSRSHAVVTLEISSPITTKSLSSSQQPYHQAIPSHKTSSGMFNNNRRSHSTGGQGLAKKHHFGGPTASLLSPTASYLQGKTVYGLDLPTKFEDVEGDRKYVRLHMVDLAGSEKEPHSFSSTHMTGGMEASTNYILKAEEEVETKWIRRSLATLGQIIQGLSRGMGERNATTHIHGACYSVGGGGVGGGVQNTLPYRDSALTWLLRNSLSGRHYTTILATLSPSHTCHEESLCTLRFTARLICSTERSCSERVNGPSDRGRSLNTTSPTPINNNRSSSLLSPTGTPVPLAYSKKSGVVSTPTPPNRPQQLRSKTPPPSSSSFVRSATPTSTHQTYHGHSYNPSPAAEPGPATAQGQGLREMTPNSSSSSRPSPSLPNNNNNNNGNNNDSNKHHAYSTLSPPQQYQQQQQRRPQSAVLSNLADFYPENIGATHPNFNPMHNNKNNNNSSNFNTVVNTTNNSNSNRMSPKEDIINGGNDSTHLRMAYQQLHAKYTLMHTEIQSVQVEKKQLELELGVALEAIEWFGLHQPQEEETKDEKSAGRGSGPGLAPGLTGKEVMELKEMLSRKEAAIEQLLEHLSEEEKARAMLEQSSKVMLVDYHTRIETLQRHNEALSRQMSQTLADAQTLPLEMARLMEERDGFKAQVSGHQDRLETTIRKLEEAHRTIAQLTNDLQTSHNHREKAEAQVLDFVASISRIKEEKDALEHERASLTAILSGNNHGSDVRGHSTVTHTSNHSSLNDDLSPDDIHLLHAENARLRLEMAALVAASTASSSKGVQATTSNTMEEAGKVSADDALQQQQQQQQQQREFTALWGSVQELNRLDTLKDEALRSVMATRDTALLERDHARSERDQAMSERDHALMQWKESNRLYEELHRDVSLIQALDMLNQTTMENGDTSGQVDTVTVDRTHSRSAVDTIAVESKSQIQSLNGVSGVDFQQTQGHSPLALVPLSTLPHYMYPPSVASTVNLYPPSSSSLSPTINSTMYIKPSQPSNSNHHQQQQHHRYQLPLPHQSTTSHVVNGRSEVIQAIVSSQHPALVSMRSPISSSKTTLQSPKLSTTPPLVASSSAVSSLKKKTSPTALKSSPNQAQQPKPLTPRANSNTNGYRTTTTTNRNILSGNGNNRSNSNGHGSNSIMTTSSSSLSEQKLIEQIDELSQYLVNHDHNRGKGLTTSGKVNSASVRS